jgi:hypothetical protein
MTCLGELTQGISSEDGPEGRNRVVDLARKTKELPSIVGKSVSRLRMSV